MVKLATTLSMIYTFTGPGDAGVALPGYRMVWALDGGESGVSEDSSEESATAAIKLRKRAVQRARKLVQALS